MIVAGFGFRSGATPESMVDALGKTPQSKAVTLIATAAAKADAPAFQSLALVLGHPARAIEANVLTRQSTLTQSDASFEAYGTGSLAEAAALAAAGPGAWLLGPRVMSSDGMATCALAEGKTP